jgi:D-threo-aldose 1-dehydrogenase
MPSRLTDRNRVGTTELTVPSFGLGTAHFGGMYHRVSGESANETMQAAWDAGVRFYDTAPWYGRGLSELRTGNFLIDRPRDEFILTTKIGRWLKRPANPVAFDRTPWGGGLNFEVVWDYSYDGVMRAYEQSLSRLGLDRIDALLIHDPEATSQANGPNIDDLVGSGIRALEELKASGQIRAIGMGLNAAASLDTYATRVPLDFCIVAMPYTLLDQSALQHGMKRCQDENVSIIIGAPYASGILATGPVDGARYGYGIADAAILEKTRRIVEICRAHKVSLQAAALQFPLAHPAVVSVIPGGVSPQEVRANVGYLEQEIPPSFWSDIRTAGLVEADAPLPSHTDLAGR